MAVLVLKKYNPKIISITGSVGKTSAKEAIFTILQNRFRARRSEKNYNNEIGLPLTIIGAESGDSSFFGWLGVFLKWLGVMVWPVEYPEILILEMGADMPGDIAYLAGFVKSNAGIITDISQSHIEFFGSLENIAKEKGALVVGLEESSLAVLNGDNAYAEKMRDKIKARTITFGFSEKADLRATDISFNYSENGGKNIKGLSFKLNYKGTSIPMRLNNILAKHQIYAALAAVAVGLEFGLNLVEIGSALQNFSLPYGRMNLIAGIKNSMVIDDTYNASPVATIAALETLGQISAPRKVAVLGDMLELGIETEKNHRSIGEKISKEKIDIFFAAGARMKFAAAELEKYNFSKENIFAFENPAEAGKKLKEIIREGDLILVKGSQGMRMEKVVEEIMAEPLQASELLCRQSPEWKKIPFKQV